jgi:hypothetical protein
MSAALPANRVHLVLAGLPQRNAEPLALNICAALQFAANTFPEFQAFVQTDLAADGFPDGFRSALADLTPEFMTQIADMVTAGVAADAERQADSKGERCSYHWVDGIFTGHCVRTQDHTGSHLDENGRVWQ